MIHGGSKRAFRHVVLPAAAPAIVLAMLWVAVQTSTEITVTNMFQVRTFAEEVYAQFSRPDPGPGVGADFALSRALAAAIPPALMMILAVSVALWLVSPRLPALLVAPVDRPIYRLGRWRWPLVFASVTVIGTVTLVPLFSLIGKVGRSRGDGPWSWATAGSEMSAASDAQLPRLRASLGSSVGTGVCCSVLVIASASVLLHHRSRANRRRIHQRITSFVSVMIIGVLLLLWILPAPVVGLGLKGGIDFLVQMEEWLLGGEVFILRSALYDGPSPLPVMWATGLRFLPCAFVLLWPLVRQLPRATIEAALTDGAGQWSIVRHAVVPPLLPHAARATVVVAALSLGELGASRLVQTPGGQTFAQEVFMQMHYGVNNHLAAMCLLLFATVALLIVTLAVIPLRWRLLHG